MDKEDMVDSGEWWTVDGGTVGMIRDRGGR